MTHHHFFTLLRQELFQCKTSHGKISAVNNSFDDRIGRSEGGSGGGVAGGAIYGNPKWEAVKRFGKDFMFALKSLATSLQKGKYL